MLRRTALAQVKQTVFSSNGETQFVCVTCFHVVPITNIYLVICVWVPPFNWLSAVVLYVLEKGVYSAASCAPGLGET